MDIFTTPVTQGYDLTDATWEIIIMLLVAFLLGWFFHWLWADGGETNTTHTSTDKGAFAKYAKDDLKIVEGIGPKIEELLKSNGVTSWNALAKSDIAELKRILATGGDRFQMHDPSSWADQASLAVTGKWEDLQNYQDLLIGGRTK